MTFRQMASVCPLSGRAASSDPAYDTLNCTAGLPAEARILPIFYRRKSKMQSIDV
jgi:hypothetical protein